MSATQSSAQRMAELAFSNLKSPTPTKTRAQEERDAEVAEQAEKNRRLRAARLERDQAEKQTAKKPAKRTSTKPAG